MLPEPKDNPKLLEDVEKIIVGLDKTIRSKKLYTQDNSVLARHRQDLILLLGNYLSTNAELKLFIEPFEIKLGEDVVYHTENKQENFAFKLFNDGIRSLTFKPGIEVNELDDFLSALIVTQKQGQEESFTDTVSTFWEKEFEHIKYAIADTLTTDIPEPGEKTTDDQVSEILDATMDHYQGTGETSKTDDDFYQAMDVTINPVSVGKMFQNTTVLEPAELEKIRRDLSECERPDRLLLDFVDMVLAVLMEETDKDTFMQFTGYLGQALENTLMQNQFHLAKILMELVCKFPTKTLPIIQSDPHIMKQVIEQMWPEQRLHMLFLGINQSEEASFEDIETLISLMDSSAVPIILQNLDNLTDSTRKKLVCRAIARMKNVDLQNHAISWINQKDLERSKLGMYMLSLTKPERILEHIPKLLQHPDPQIKKEGLGLLKKCSGPKVTDILFTLLKDPDIDVRITALKLLALKSEKAVAQRLGMVISSNEFHKFALPEKKAYFMAIAKIAGDDLLPFLDGIFQTKDWFGNRSLRELILCAALALITIRSEKSMSVLKNLLVHGNKTTRQALESLIKDQSGALR